MKTKYFLMIGIVLILTISLIFVGVHFNEEEESKVELLNNYQGAVPEGYDLEYFRETGRTIKLGGDE